jgi:uncharacterized protein (TIGR03086 family)
MTNQTDETDQTGQTLPPYFPATAPAAFRVPEQVVGLLEPVLGDLAALVDAPRSADLARATPCERLDVAGLRDHVVGWLRFFAAALSDPDARAPRPDPDGYRAAEASGPLADDVRAAASQMVAAVRGGVTRREVVLWASRMDGDAALAMILGEYVLHGWDLARALGRPWAPPPAACEAALQFFEAMIVPAYRVGEGAFFGPEVPVPAGANPLDRLLGFAGRDPGWAGGVPLNRPDA